MITPVKYDCWCMRRFSDLQGEAESFGVCCRLMTEFSTALGTAGRWFESSCPDQIDTDENWMLPGRTQEHPKSKAAESGEGNLRVDNQDGFPTSVFEMDQPRRRCGGGYRLAAPPGAATLAVPILKCRLA